MATQIFEKEVLVLQDAETGEAGKEITITPLPIKPLRKFMAEYRKMADAETEDDMTDVIFNCALIAVQARNKDVTAEDLEDSLDLNTAIKILEVAGGIKMDPNQ